VWGLVACAVALGVGLAVVWYRKRAARAPAIAPERAPEEEDFAAIPNLPRPATDDPPRDDASSVMPAGASLDSMDEAPPALEEGIN
jgi:hypothetical protein